MTHTHRLYESGIREVLKGRHWALLKNVSYCFLNFIYLSLRWLAVTPLRAGLSTGRGSVYLLVGRCCFQHNIILWRPALVWSAAGLKGFLEGFVDLVDGGGGDHVWGQQWGVWLTSTPFRWKHYGPLAHRNLVCRFKNLALCVAIGYLTNTWGPLVDQSRAALLGSEPQTHWVPNGQFVAFMSSSLSSRGWAECSSGISL